MRRPVSTLTKSPVFPSEAGRVGSETQQMTDEVAVTVHHSDIRSRMVVICRELPRVRHARPYSRRLLLPPLLLRFPSHREGPSETRRLAAHGGNDLRFDLAVRSQLPLARVETALRHSGDLAYFRFQSIATIDLHGVAGLHADQRGRRRLALHSQPGQLPVQSVSCRAVFMIRIQTKKPYFGHATNSFRVRPCADGSLTRGVTREPGLVAPF